MSTSIQKSPTYEPQNMKFRNFGGSGLRVSLFALGGWLTYGGSVQDEMTEKIMKLAFEKGITTFDTAEVYSAGECEVSMGKAIKNLGWRRSDVVLITKIFFGYGGKDPNAKGLSRKHILEGVDASLQRAQLENWDIVMAHRYDPSVPMIEIVKSFNHLISQGKCHYWGTSEWSVQQIQEAISIADKLGLDPPFADQAQYNAFKRDRVESEYAPLYKNHHFGLTIWSPLASGLLTGKYNDGIPQGSRFDTNKDSFNDTIQSLQSEEGKAKIEKVRKLEKIAQSLDCNTAQLSLAWAASNPNVSTVILGATKTEQLLDNLKALDVLDKITPDVHKQIEDILQNKPAAAPTYGRL